MKYIITVITFVTLITFASCGRNRRPAEAVVRTAKIDTVRARGGEQSAVYPAKVQTEAEATLAFRVAGTIARLPHAEGAPVGKGTVIAELDARDYRVQLAATEAEYNQVKAAAERVMELYRRGSATKSEYEKAVYGLEQITAKYNNDKNRLADTRLSAPFDGYIRAKIRREGEVVGAGAPVIALIGKGGWQVETNLSARDYARRHDFAGFDAAVSTHAGLSLPLTLTELAPKGNAGQSYRAVFRVSDTRGVPLAAGMSAEVTVRFRPAQDTVCEIPIEALFERNGQPCVWVFVAADCPLTARPVIVGALRSDGRIAVTGGLKAGELIVVAGVHAIKDGMTVRPLPAVSATNAGGLWE
ncbi:MAG: efflux RND transporter periplasmic adaptor subunit [Prevotellaceae bacterium]|jgi:RND family efflux transporter MFP subunit|nr:efflux RND transporter periplasmic adaptor subunit [Prevotellaceae bacterium]